VTTPVDLDTFSPTVKNAFKDSFTEQPYDPRPGEDSARRRIAYGLLLLLGFVVFASFLSFWGGSAGGVDPLIKFTQVLLGPIVPLVSAATGFYYGTKSNK
jgi:hypothetical protein